MIRPCLIRKRNLYWPTWKGWVLVVGLLAVPPIWWWLRGESFLAKTGRVDANVLVVEGWIGSEGVAAAAREFRDGAYEYAVATGGMSEPVWTEERWSYAELASKVLQGAGIPPERVVVAQSAPSVAGRTYESAVATRKALEARGIRVSGINVFTKSAHARRSRLLFDKVFGREVEVGVIGWLPPGHGEGSWRSSTERAESFLQESVGYAYEWLWDSGRSDESMEADLR